MKIKMDGELVTLLGERRNDFRVIFELAYIPGQAYYEN